MTVTMTLRRDKFLLIPLFPFYPFPFFSLFSNTPPRLPHLLTWFWSISRFQYPRLT